MTTPESDSVIAATAGESLRQWMVNPANLHGREAILMHRLCLDMQLAAAQRGYYLNTYYDDVDHDGFDLIFDDQATVKKTQVKTVDSKAGTGKWGIYKRMLRPLLEHVDQLGFEASPEGVGVEGGFILIQFDTSVLNLGVRYFYTDLHVWLAFQCGVIRRRDGRSQAAVENCLKSLQYGLGNELVDVPWALMLEAKGPAELLALSGLHSHAAHIWGYHVFTIANHERQFATHDRKLSHPLPDLKRIAADEIRVLALDTDLIDGEL
jgi:hypothetical protein